MMVVARQVRDIAGAADVALVMLTSTPLFHQRTQYR